MATPFEDNNTPSGDPIASTTLTSLPQHESTRDTNTENLDPPKAEKGDSDTIHQVPSVDDLERADTIKEAALDHPASVDDVLSRTIHLEDDPSLPSITVRSVFLGKTNQWKAHRKSTDSNQAWDSQSLAESCREFTISSLKR